MYQIASHDTMPPLKPANEKPCCIVQTSEESEADRAPPALNPRKVSIIGLINRNVGGSCRNNELM